MFTMPITTNKPVNFILFSIVLLVIMGLCICIAPDTAYAAYVVPSNRYIPPIPLSCPKPPESDYSGWFAISDGSDVRVYIISYVPDDVASFGPPHVQITDIDNVNDRFTIAYASGASGYITLGRWDSDGPSYRLLNVYQNVYTTAYRYDAWPTPNYIAYGGCVTLEVDDYSILSFVPEWSSVGVSSLDYWNALQDISSSLSEISVTLNSLDSIASYSLAISDNTYSISSSAASMKTSLSSISQLLQMSIASITTSDGLDLYGFSSFIERATSPEFFDILDDINSNLSTLDGLGDSVERLNQAIAQMEDSFDQIIYELDELVDSIDKETRIWEDASSSYRSLNYSSNSVDSWTWLARFVNRFINVGNFERSSSDYFYSLSPSSPGDSGSFSVINWLDLFKAFLSPEPPSDDPDFPDAPSDFGLYSPGWYYVDLGGLP